MIALATLNHELDRRGGCQTLDDDYWRWAAEAGIRLVTLPSSDRLPSFGELDALGASALILTGGNDVDPALYKSANTHSRGLSPLRDTFEGRLFDWALERGTRVLGICRGFQFINTRLGGTLVQDLSLVSEPHEGRGLHHVELDEAMSLTLNLGRSHSVDSRHHQCALDANLAPGLRVWARAGSVVEAFHLPGRSLAAVQWHPESPKSGRELSNVLARALRDGGAFWGPS